MGTPELLLGELQEFKRATLERLEKIDGKIDTLRGFHWKVAGGVSVLVFLVEVGLAFLK